MTTLDADLAGPDGAIAAHRSWLPGAALAGWLFDTERSLLLAANAQGARRLGAVDGSLPRGLDAAMPAMRRLREISARSMSVPASSYRAGAAPGVAVRETLLFWTCQGAEWIVCDVQHQPESAAGRLLVREVASRGGIDPATRVAGHGAAGPAAGPTDTPSESMAAGPDSESAAAPASDAARAGGEPVVRDDAATLREIARRIRAAQAGFAPPVRASPSNDHKDVRLRGVPDPERRPPAVGPGARAIGDGADPHDAGPQDAVRQGSDRQDANPQDASPQDAACGEAGHLQQVDVSRLAHELKTPLSAIVAAAEIMRDEQLGRIGNERYRGYASDIHDSARHALAVINSMLVPRAASRDGGGGGADAAVPQHLQFSQIDVTALVEGTVSAMRPLAEQAGLQLVASLAPRLPQVIVDAITVKQILLNLLTNAIKFTPRAGIVSVATRHTRDGAVEITVSDTGSGISEAAIRRSLDPGAVPAPQLTGGGLGIGLPLVRRLASANGASIGIASQPGAGTQVVLSFPRDRVVPV